MVATLASSIVHRQGKHRFELSHASLDSKQSTGECAFLAYNPGCNASHVWLEVHQLKVPKCMQGHGVAGVLCMAVFKYAAEHKVKIVPVCRYITNRYIIDHPEHMKLILNGAKNTYVKRAQAYASQNKRRDRSSQSRDESHGNTVSTSTATATATAASNSNSNSSSNSTSQQEAKVPLSHSRPSESTQNRTRVTVAPGHAPLPHHPLFQARWKVVQQLLGEKIKDADALAGVLGKFSPRRKGVQHWRSGLRFWVNSCLNDESRHDFFHNVLPFMQRQVLSLPQRFDESASICLLNTGRAGRVDLTQAQIVSLLASSWFVLHPEGKYDHFHSSNFDSLFERVHRDPVATGAKLNCLFNYFRRMSAREQESNDRIVSFVRCVMPCEPKEFAQQLTVAEDVHLMPMDIYTDGTIEDAGVGHMQVDFANKFIGGGVLNRGAVQEEIRFMLSPECIASLLFTEVLRHDEAVLIIGTERFSSYTGYGRTFKFAGDYVDQVPTDQDGRLACAIIAIDAVPLYSQSAIARQFQPNRMAREALKAYVGFNADEKQLAYTYSTIATGNWGAGAFNHCVMKQAILQWIAASLAGKKLTYYTFADEALRDGLEHITKTCLEKHLSVAELWELMVKFSQGPEDEESGDEYPAEGLLWSFMSDVLSQTTATVAE
jgi:predicted GNAT family acetyltransferase